MQQKRIQLSKIVFVFLVVLGCQQEKKLPFLGPKEIGKQGDTLYHKIPDFKFLNQDSLWISEKDMAGKIYVADFFFTTCRSVKDVKSCMPIKAEAASRIRSLPSGSRIVQA